MTDVVNDPSAGVRIHVDGQILRVELCRPEVRNAQTPATWRALARIPEIVREFPCDFVVLTGQGSSFSAGLDRRMFTPEGVPGERSLLSLAQESDTSIDDFICEAQQAFTWPARVAQPVIAYVQGHAVGAGCQLALAADLTFVAPDAQFSLKESMWGLVPDLGVTGPLVAAVGYQRALFMCLTGEPIEASDAVSLGLAVGIVPTSDWSRHEVHVTESFRQLPAGTAADLKYLLTDAKSGEAQLERERQTQIRRLRSLAKLTKP